MIAGFQGCNLDAHYLAYFDYFNRQLFFEAHEVLEELWLGDRHGANAIFYKGLIQLAGAFVHVQKGRASPAVALFQLACNSLSKYPGVHEQLDVKAVLGLIEAWLRRMRMANSAAKFSLSQKAPKLHLPS